MRRRDFVKLGAAALPLAGAERKARTVDIRCEVVEDKIRGGFLGQLIGDLNGLKHEMKYIAEPGDVREYTPALPDGGWTDDDTDIEWPYLIEMERSGTLLIAPSRIAELWKKHINRKIWCSHLYLRQLMDLGLEPPLTGRQALNPWAGFNLSGQFVSESWGLISPGMPQTAARIGLHYTHVAVDGEAVQSTQMMTAMIATAFLTSDMGRVLDAGAAALDPSSTMSKILADVRRWHHENPRDWRATRKLTKDRYCLYGGDDMRDRNGVWLNGASTIAALLYGRGDFVETLRCAFNLGWDADNNAAAAGTVVGVMKGGRWMVSQGWNIRDLYRNTSRDELPSGETLTQYGTRLTRIAERNILAQGGSRLNGAYRIAIETPASIEALVDPERRAAELRREWRERIETAILRPAGVQEQARAAYLAIGLDIAPEMRARDGAAWAKAVAALNGFPRVLQALFYEAPVPAGDRLREKALAAGVQKPAAKIKL